MSEQKDRPKCRQCGKLLSAYKYADAEWNRGKDRRFGYEGNNFFCTLRCGFYYGLRCVQTEAITKSGLPATPTT